MEMKTGSSILSDIDSLLRKETKNCPSQEHDFIAIRVSRNCFHQMCKEDPSIYDTKKFCGIPIWRSETDVIKVIFGIQV